QCRYQPPAAAMCAPGKGIGLISYARLEHFIHNISRRLLRLGLSPRSVVATLFDDAIFEAVVTLALMRVGMVSLSARGQKLPPELKVAAVICDKNVPFTNAGRVVIADPSWTTGEGKPLEPQE